MIKFDLEPREDDALTIKHDGNVGIGSTQPAVKLDVNGTINSHNDITINGTSVLSTAENDAVARNRIRIKHGKYI